MRCGKGITLDTPRRQCIGTLAELEGAINHFQLLDRCVPRPICVLCEDSADESNKRCCTPTLLVNLSTCTLLEVFAQVARSGAPIRPSERALLFFRNKHDAQQEPSKGTAHTPRTLRIHFTMCKSHVFRNCQLTATRRNTSTARTITLPKRNTAGTQHGASPCQLA